MLLVLIGGLIAWGWMTLSQPALTQRVSQNRGATARLDQIVDNGFQFRDNMFSSFADWIGHPDVKNNYLSRERQPGAISDKGVFGVPRTSVQLYPGVSEPMQLYRTDNLLL